VEEVEGFLGNDPIGHWLAEGLGHQTPWPRPVKLMEIIFKYFIWGKTVPAFKNGWFLGKVGRFKGKVMNNRSPLPRHDIIIR
jgi:hypothetical protein